MPSLVACAMGTCKWNRDGQCDKSEIFVDGGTSCASFEPDMGAMLGPQGADPRSALLQMIAGGGPPMGGPPVGGPPISAPVGGPPISAPVGGPPIGATPRGMPGMPLGGMPPSQI